MTEKKPRFKMDNVSDIIEFDYNTNEYVQDFMWADGKSWDRICNRLNELYEENEQLEKSIEQLRTIIDDNIDFNSLFTNRELSDICNETGWELSEKSIKLQQLEKENERLKRRNNGLQFELQIFKEEVKHSDLQINKLVDENERLKKENGDLKETIKDLHDLLARYEEKMFKNLKDYDN